MITVNTNPSRRQLKQFAGIWLPLLSCLLGYIVFFKLKIEVPAAVLCVSGLSVSVFGFFYPEKIKPVFVGLMYITYPIGFIVSYIILALLFFTVLTPIALLMRLLKFDPLERSFDIPGKSYWKSIEYSDKTGQYFKQY